MFLYAIGMMFSPGPMNFIGINIGLKDKIKKSLGFYFGISASIFLYTSTLGYAGGKVVKKEYLLYFSLIGSAYIIYLAYKLWKSNPKTENTSEEAKEKGLGFIDAFIGQSFNPKAPIALLPITVIYFPSNNIVGSKIVFISLFLGVLGGFAPFIYSLFGKFMGSIIKSKMFFIVFNRVMAIFLVFLAGLILRDHVYLVITGVHAF